MGEIRKILGKTTFADNLCEYLDMELNQDGVIHLQTNCWRIELPGQWRLRQLEWLETENRLE